MKHSKKRKGKVGMKQKRKKPTGNSNKWKEVMVWGIKTIVKTCHGNGTELEEKWDKKKGIGPKLSKPEIDD